VSSILNRAATKKYVLMRFKEIRAGRPMERVSKEYLDNLEFWLKRKMDSDIESHPSIGKTFKP
jgi:hypothetical protein